MPFRRARQGVAAILALLGAAVSVPYAVAPPDTARFRDDRVIVKLRSGFAARADALPENELPSGLEELNETLASLGIDGGHRLVRTWDLPVGDPELFREIGLDRIYVLELAQTDRSHVLKIVDELSKRPWVEYAEPVYIFELQTTTPNDPLFTQQWPHENQGQSGGTWDADMDSTQAWDFGTGNPTGVVAVLDSGVDTNHPDLAPNLIPGFDFTFSPEGVEDHQGHGTSVSGNAAARGDNGEGVAGVCWTCSIMPLKIVSAGGFITIEEIADATRYAADNGADAINMSFSGGAWTLAFIDAIDYAAGLGALSVASSGNGGTYSPVIPAAYPGALSVAGTDHDDLRYGSYGDHADIAAPTDAITTELGGTYGDFRGTSGAAPRAAGLTALLRSVDPDLHVQELRQLLRLGAEDEVGDPAEDKPGWDPFLGYGRINAHASMLLIDGPWLALDRPHYLCAGELAVDLKDRGAGGSVGVTLTGSLGGDSEIVTTLPFTAGGYYRGSIPLSWATPGPVAPGDGKLDVVDGETVTATAGALEADAFLECAKTVCLTNLTSLPASGDCDDDGFLDPGELWNIGATFTNWQTEEMFEVVARLSSTDPGVEVILDAQSDGSIYPFYTSALMDFSFRVAAGSPADQPIGLTFATSGTGWISEPATCRDAGYVTTIPLTSNRDPTGPETWPAFPPSSLAGSDGDCPSGFDLTWDVVPAAAGYNVYRSPLSCADAQQRSAPHDTTAAPAYTDTDAGTTTSFFYAVEAQETGTGCVSERACIAGGCLCAAPADPSGLLVRRISGDLLLSWDDPGPAGLTWNVYRDTGEDPALWGPALHEQVTDQDPGTPGIQFTDPAAASAGTPLYYLVTADNGCVESPLR